ncbi:MAG: hypothetical protein AVDCRST_MAG78-446, partial [uncultured Rubrobacteraceae bacterium]
AAGSGFYDVGGRDGRGLPSRRRRLQEDRGGPECRGVPGLLVAGGARV